MRERIREQLKDYAAIITDEKIEQFYQYYLLIKEWNSFMNLTAITEFDEVLEKHFLDSIKLMDYVAFNQVENCKILDLGTGAGFPGIPLKIMMPDVTFVLMDSLNKRIKFLNEVISRLGLKKITAIHGRAEEMARNPEYRENFDYVVSRAVANLSTLSEFCIPFVKKGGYFIPYKSGNVEGERIEASKAVELLGGSIKETSYFQLGEDMERSFVFIEKKKETPKKYPRAGGKPVKEPLK